MQVASSAPPASPSWVEAERGARAARVPLGIGAAAAAGTILLALVDPNRPGRYGFCPLEALTGLACPACGCLRATHALAHLDVGTAMSDNPLWTVAVPFLVVAWGFWLARRWTGGPRMRPERVRHLAVAALGVAVVFGVLRNIPVLTPWLGP